MALQQTAMSATTLAMMARPLLALAGKEFVPIFSLRGQNAAQSRGLSTGPKQHSLLVADVTESGSTPSLLGVYNYLSKNLPSVGFFSPIGGKDLPAAPGLKTCEAKKLLAAGKSGELLDQVFTKYMQYADSKEFCVVAGPGATLGSSELDAQIASSLSTPVLMTVTGKAGWTADDYYNAAMIKADMFKRNKCTVAGVAVDKVSSEIAADLKERFSKAGLAFASSPEDVKAIQQWLDSTPRDTKMTPKMFQYTINSKCLANPQHIVLPESYDKRILAAAAEVTQKGLAKVTLLGDPAVVLAEAQKLGLDLSKCNIVDPKSAPALDKYVDAYIKARGSKAPPREEAKAAVIKDINLFGVMMVELGDCDGMVSGAANTTAATIRPAMQVLKVPGKKMLVSSVFFMCLPTDDTVLTYADCAVNPNPSAEDLANIAVTSAETTAAFGIEPRVAMLSYSTMGSGAGPDVQKVIDAVAAARKAAPALKLEGPLQYDAAIDPKVAAVKIKGNNPVAGKATVFVFPDLNTGNNCYKAVQQATGGLAIGPVMQGLSKPVNDLSRGCTVDDVVNTICVTSVQALGAKEAKK